MRPDSTWSIQLILCKEQATVCGIMVRMLSLSSLFVQDTMADGSSLMYMILRECAVRPEHLRRRHRHLASGFASTAITAHHARRIPTAEHPQDVFVVRTVDSVRT
ncbi:unnamed protein product [Polarella glacialis]|uniref:Uncharacterized protein n=1 Tax=Polarella glacialis TaxID=89957 RepID=A0A813IPC1_POLGL|nr:unnamed protein product [Polarella glacialis]